MINQKLIEIAISVMIDLSNHLLNLITVKISGIFKAVYLPVLEFESDRRKFCVLNDARVKRLALV